MSTAHTDLPFPTQLQGVTDLTVLAPIKRGLIKGIFDSRSYAWRLKSVLTMLDAARHAQREAVHGPAPLPDLVGRLRAVHFFRFAILQEENKLLLNVTFDGGWEPYMRLIWGPLGTMLDLIFCHCEGYPLAAVSDYADYIRWVRQHEVPSQFFYADSAGSVADRAYLQQLEALQRSQGHQPNANLRSSQLALQPEGTPPASRAAVAYSLRVLKSLYGLKPLFGEPLKWESDNPASDDGSVLLRFAQDFLLDLRSWVGNGHLDVGGQFDDLGAAFPQERQWLMNPKWRRKERTHTSLPAPSELQAGLLSAFRSTNPKKYLVGAVLLLQVTDAKSACRWLTDGAAEKGWIRTAKSSEIGTENDIAATVALTYNGLQALEVPLKDLDMLPREFVQGMEARAGLLGDWGVNHPQNWQRPRRNRANGAEPPIDLGMVHIVIQLRSVADGPLTGTAPFEQWVEEKLKGSGVQPLSLDVTWSRPVQGSDLAPRNHFGYVDGLSQPKLEPDGAREHWDDHIQPGELLLGHVNGRGDGPRASEPSWLQNGTFLVVRKIRMDVARFNAFVDQAAKTMQGEGFRGEEPDLREWVRAKLMGRHSDGRALVPTGKGGQNDFNYRHDGDAAGCPFASHVRRANPRNPQERPPRILRRGMSWGPANENESGDRGLFFMAYNASIAEQFEVLQRWITGGNSSGVSTSQPDPFLFVPKAGEPLIWRFSHEGQVVRVNLGDQPICRLDWGLYAFVPSMNGLRELFTANEAHRATSLASPQTQSDGASSQDASGNEQTPLPTELNPVDWEAKAWFEDEIGRKERWKDVRTRDECVLRLSDGSPHIAVGGLERVQEVLSDNGARFSASGYDKRMGDSLGRSVFGQDDGLRGGHAQEWVKTLKGEIEKAVPEEDAYNAGYEIISRLLEQTRQRSAKLGLPDTVDVIELGTHLIGFLVAKWFGLGKGIEDLTATTLAENAAHTRQFLDVARFVFSACPNQVVRGSVQKIKDGGEIQGLLKDVLGREDLSPLTRAVKGSVVSADEQVPTLANLILGLPATTLGTWGKVLRRWVERRELWQHQMAIWSQVTDSSLKVSYECARKALRNALVTSMAADPVADGIWRTAAKDAKLGNLTLEGGEKLWLGLGSALTDTNDLVTAEDLMFGGKNAGAPHYCPGRPFAIAALLGALTALLMAGTWSATASPTVLTLSK